MPPYFYRSQAGKPDGVEVVTAGGRRAGANVADVVRVFNEFPEGARPAFQEARGAIRVSKGGAAAGNADFSEQYARA